LKDNDHATADFDSVGSQGPGVGPWSGPLPDDPRLDPELLRDGDHRNVVDEYRYWKLDAIVADLDSKRNPFHIAIENLEHDFNIGSIVRTANAFLAEEIHIVGRKRWNRRGAMVTDRYQHIRHHESVNELKAWAAEAGIPIIGIDNVPAEIFEVFDYVALGHIHRPQHVYKETIRYAGTPLKYSFSEAGHDKSLTVIECREKGHCLLRTLPLKPLRDLLEIKGSYMTLTARDFYQGLDTKAYYHVTLTDEEDIPDAVGKLRAVYPNLMKLDYDNQRTRSNREILGDEDVDQKSPLVLFQEFYEQQNNQPLSEDQLEFTAALMETIWEGEV